MGEGYFIYENDGFGPVIDTHKEAVCELLKFLKNDSENPIYKKRRADFFTLRDNKNCERTYNAIKEKLDKR